MRSNPNRPFRLEYLNHRYTPARWSWLGSYATEDAAKAAVPTYGYRIRGQETRITNRNAQ